MHGSSCGFRDLLASAQLQSCSFSSGTSQLLGQLLPNHHTSNNRRLAGGCARAAVMLMHPGWHRRLLWCPFRAQTVVAGWSGASRPSGEHHDSGAVVSSLKPRRHNAPADWPIAAKQQQRPFGLSPPQRSGATPNPTASAGSSGPATAQRARHTARIIVVVVIHVALQANHRRRAPPQSRRGQGAAAAAAEGAPSSPTVVKTKC